MSEDDQEWPEVDGAEIVGVDDEMAKEAARYLLKGEGEHRTDGHAKAAGFDTAAVRPFGDKCVDVWFLPDDERAMPVHTEFGRVGGSLLWIPKEQPCE
jgi:hypothetical protein